MTEDSGVTFQELCDQHNLDGLQRELCWQFLQYFRFKSLEKLLREEK